MTQVVEETASKVPTEIQAAIDAFNGETEQAIIVVLLNEGELAFSELKTELSTEDDELHNQTLTDSLRALQRGGLINKRTIGDESPRFSSYYEVSEYGERFVDRLLETLGSVDSFTRSDPEYERVDNIHDQTQQDEPRILLEAYRSDNEEEHANTTAGT